jgi:hypothetical protein
MILEGAPKASTAGGTFLVTTDSIPIITKDPMVVNWCNTADIPIC